MSDNMMSAKEARSWLDPSTGPKPEVPSPLLVNRYARTVIEQAEQIERVRAVLTDLQGQQEATWQSWEAYDDIWDGAVSDTLRYAIHRITEALEGEE